MPEQVLKYTEPLKARWDLMTKQQRYKLIGVIVAVLLALVLTAYFAFRTKWTVLIAGQDINSTSLAQNALNDAGIKNKIADYGATLLVDSRRVNDARGIIITSDTVPNSQHFTWGDALDLSIGTTDAERRQAAILAKEGQTATQLISINGINRAIVTFTIPPSRPFESDPVLPSASVTLTVTDEFSLNQGRNLAILVARNVSRLDIENIIIMDQYARPVWNGADDVTDDTLGATLLRQEQYRNQALVAAHQILGQIFDEVAASFAPVFDETLLTEEIVRLFSIPEGMEDTGIPHVSIGTNASMTGGTAANEPGLANNNAAFPNYVNPSNNEMSASQREWDITYSIDVTETVTQSGPGWVDPDRSNGTASVVAHRYVLQDAWMNQGEEGETRTQADWEQFKLDNARPVLLNSEFDGFDEHRAQLASAYGLPIDRVALTIHERVVPIDTVARSWDIPTILMVAVMLLLLAMILFGLLRKQKIAGEEEEALEPQLAVEDLLVSTQLEEAKEEAAQELEEIDYFKENEVKRHIEKFVNEKPEAVAALLRNWINVEEW